MDCSKTENYLKERERMTGNCDMFCAKCPLGYGNNSFRLACEKFENKHPQKAIEIVQKWSDEHLQKTILDNFLGKFPKVALDESGVPKDVCCGTLGYKLAIHCLQNDCTDCWKQPFNGFVEESK